MPPSCEALVNEAGQVVGPDADEVHDADVRQHPIGGPLVNRGGANAEYLRDPAHGDQLLDWR